MIELYGIRQCDTCRKAWQWLDEQGIEYTFHDLRREGIDRATVDAWAAAVGTDALVNRRGQTWRKLDPAEREVGEPGLRALLAGEPMLIKRPVAITSSGVIHVGWNDAIREALSG